MDLKKEIEEVNDHCKELVKESFRKFCGALILTSIAFCIAFLFALFIIWLLW